MATMNTTETARETLQVVLAIAICDDDADTWPAPGSHESFVNDCADESIDAYAQTVSH